MQFGMGSQSREIRDNLYNFSKFLQHFSQAKWLGDLIAPEFEEQKKLAVKILAELQTETRVVLPACGKPQGYSTVGAKTISISAREASSIYSSVACGNGSLAKLQGLLKMFQKVEAALRTDVEARQKAEKASFSDLI